MMYLNEWYNDAIPSPEYGRLQLAAEKASYSEDSDVAEFAKALRAFLDKYVA